MRRILLILVLILAGVFAVLSFLDRSEYALEKNFWYLKKDFAKLAHDPKSYPEQEFKALAREYDQLLEAHPESRLAGKILIQKGMVYVLMKDSEKARETFREILARFPDEGPLNAEALFQIGKTYEQEGKSKEAVQMFRTASERYPLTLTGLKMPLYEANYYQRIGKPDKMQVAFDRAVDFYQNIHEEHADTRIGYMALNYQVTAYLAQERWSESLNVLERILMIYPRVHQSTDPQGPLLVRTINQVALEQAKDSGRAIEIYRKFIHQYPQHPFTPGFEKLIEKIQQRQQTDQGQDGE